MSEDTTFTLPQLPDGVRSGSVPVENAPSTCFVMIRGLKGVTTYMRQRLKFSTTSGTKLFSKNLARWREGTAPTLSELESLISLSRCNYILLRNGVDPKTPGLRIPEWLTHITNLNYDLTDQDCLFSSAGETSNCVRRPDTDSGTGAGTGKGTGTGTVSDIIPAVHSSGAAPFADADVGDLCLSALFSSTPSGTPRCQRSGTLAKPSRQICQGISTQISAVGNLSYSISYSGQSADPRPLVWTLGTTVARCGNDKGIGIGTGRAPLGLATSRCLTVSVNGCTANASLLADWRIGTGAWGCHGGSGGSSGNLPGSDGRNYPSFEQICNEYMENPQLKENTVKLYQGIIRRILAPRFEDFRDLRSLTAARAAKLILIPLISEEKISTAHTTRSVLGAIVRQAQRVHDLSALENLNQLRHMDKIAKLTPIGDTEKPFAAMITGDIGTNIGMIFRCFQQKVKSLKIRALLELSCHLCLRQSEILRIRIQDVYFEEHRLHIGWTKTITAKSGGFDIPMTETTEDIIREIIAIREQEAASSRKIDVAARDSSTCDSKAAKGGQAKNDGAKTGKPEGSNRKGAKSGSAAGCSADAGSGSGSDSVAETGGSGSGSYAGSGPDTAPQQLSKGSGKCKLGGNTFLFATRPRNAKGNGAPQQQQPSNTLSTYIRKIPELKGHQTAHGIRALFRTWASRNGIDNDLAECVLSHKCWNRIKLAYNRDLRNYLYDQRRSVMKQWSDFIVQNVGDASILRSKGTS